MIDLSFNGFTLHLDPFSSVLKASIEWGCRKMNRNLHPAYKGVS